MAHNIILRMSIQHVLEIYRRLRVKKTRNFIFMNVQRDQTGIEIPSNFNIFDVDKFHF